MKRALVAALIAYISLIFFVSTRPYLRAPGPEFDMKDDLAHVVEYFILGALLMGAVGFAVTPDRRLTFLFLVAIGTTIGALDEVLQAATPGRQRALSDWVADAVGVAAGVGVFVRRRAPAARAQAGGRAT